MCLKSSHLIILGFAVGAHPFILSRNRRNSSVCRLSFIINVTGMIKKAGKSGKTFAQISNSGSVEKAV